MVFHPRGLLPQLLDRLERMPVTVLTGARQTGKTTLVRDLLPGAGGPPYVYISLDDPDERLRLAADPVRRLDQGNRFGPIILTWDISIIKKDVLNFR